MLNRLIILCFCLSLEGCSHLYQHTNTTLSIPADIDRSERYFAAHLKALQSESLWIQNQLIYLSSIDPKPRPHSLMHTEANRLQTRQEKLISLLSKQAQLALEHDDPITAQNLLETLLQLPLTDSDKQIIASLQQKLVTQQLKAMPTSTKNPDLLTQNKMTMVITMPKNMLMPMPLTKHRPHTTRQSPLRAVQQALTEKNLKRLQKELDQLNTRTDLTFSEKLQILQLRMYLNQQLSQLDAQADRFYQEGQVDEAYSIWKVLSDINPRDGLLKAKEMRAKTVLSNLKNLQEKNNKSNQTTDAQTSH